MRGIKIIDKLLVKSFIPPLIATFFVATFILVLQFLWVWIDEIAGKGLGLFTLIELIYFATIKLIPLSLPISILLAAVMVMGNLGEKNELSSFKSAGIPLQRVIRPILTVSVFVAMFSYICSDYIIPYAQLKYFTRLWEIKTAKPALNLQPGLFNTDFKGYAINIKEKDADGEFIKDIIIYNLGQSNAGQYNYLHAKSGRMYTTEDQNFFIMDLDSVYQIQEMAKSVANRNEKAPQVIRAEFDNLVKVFDMSEFKLTRRDEDNFKNNQQILTVKELNSAIDTIGFKYDEAFLRVDYEYEKILPGYSDVLEDNRARLTAYRGSGADEARTHDMKPVANQDSVRLEEEYRLKMRREFGKEMGFIRGEAMAEENRNMEITIPAFAKAVHMGDTIQHVFETVEFTSRRRLGDLAKASIRNSIGGLQIAEANADLHYHARRMHIYTLHEKFNIAFVCIVFLLIGASMGAIVRKGGFGYSFLIAVIFFVLFIMMNIAFKKITESSDFSPILGAWMPSILLLPVGLLLLDKAMKDKKLSIDMEKLKTWWANRKNAKGKKIHS